MKTALLTGGAGYIGSHVGLALQDAGWRIVIVDDLSTGAREAIPPGVAFYEGEIGDESLLETAFSKHSIDAVVHLAAVASVPESVADPEKCDRINRRDTGTLVRVARHCRVPHFVFSSTSVVYDENTPPPYAEDSPLGPKSPYAASKLAAERIIAAAGFSGFAVLRYFNVGGADKQLRAGCRKAKDTTLIQSALECASGRRPLLCIYGTDYPTADGTCVRDYVHVSDIATAHVLALDYLQVGGASDVFNLGLGRGFSVREVIDVARKVTGIDIPVQDAPRREGDPPAIFADASKAKRTLEFLPAAQTLDGIISDSWAWVRHRY